MMWRYGWIGVCVALCARSVVGCATPDDAPAVAQDVELDRYLGTWYEQGHFEMRQQKGCHGTTATYAMREDGDILVKNRCYDGSWSANIKEAEARAWLADPEVSNARLKVQFFWPFRGDYWILDVDEDYEWAIVGTPDRESLWLLTRAPVVDQAYYDTLVQKARSRGYLVEHLIRTPQKPLDARP